jgi:hypothetical protein
MHPLRYAISLKLGNQIINNEKEEELKVLPMSMMEQKAVKQ